MRCLPASERDLLGIESYLGEKAEPVLDVAIAFLSDAQLTVVGLLILFYGRCQAAQRRETQTLGQGRVGDRAPYPAVSVIEGMDRLEPETCDPRTDRSWQLVSRLVVPVDESIHLRLDPTGGRRPVVHFQMPGCPGHNLHLVVTVRASRNVKEAG